MMCFDISVEFFALKLLGSLFIRSAKADHALVISVESIKLKIRENVFQLHEIFFQLRLGKVKQRVFCFCFGKGFQRLNFKTLRVSLTEYLQINNGF